MDNRTLSVVELVGVWALVVVGGWFGWWVGEKVRNRILRMHIDALLDRVEKVEELERRQRDVE